MAQHAAAQAQKQLLETYGKTEGKHLVDLLSRYSQNSVSIFLALYNGIAAHLSSLAVGTLKTLLSRFFSSPLYTSYFLPDSTYIDYIAPVLSSYLSLHRRFPSPSTYPDFPMKTIFEYNRVNMAGLNAGINRELQPQYESVELDSAPDVFLLYVRLSLAGFSKQEDTRAMIDFFLRTVSGSPDESKYYLLLVKMLLIFSHKRGVPFTSVLSIFNTAMQKNGVPSRDLIFILYDFYLDNRYSHKHLLSLFSLIRTCINSFYPERKQLIPDILLLLKDFIRISRAGNSQYLKTIFELYVQNPHLDLSRWVEEGARLIREYGDDSQSAAAYFHKESDLSKKIWREIDSGIYFDQVYSRLQIVVNAITEGDIKLKSNDRRTGIENGSYYTDGKTIFIPHYVNYVKDREKNYTVLLHSIAHECAHIEFGSFEKNRQRYLETSRELKQRFPGEFATNKKLLSDYLQDVRDRLQEYGYPVVSIRIEPEDASYLTRLLFHVEFPFLLNNMWNVLEDYRVNRLLYRKYTGYGKEKELVDEIDFTDVADISEVSPIANLINGFIQTAWFGKRKGELQQEVIPYHKALTACFHEFTSLSSPDSYNSMNYAGTLYRTVIRFMNRHTPGLLQQMRRQGRCLHLDFSLLGIKNASRNAPVQLEMESMKSQLRSELGEGLDIEETAEKQRGQQQFREILHKHTDFHERMQLENNHELYFYPEWDYEKTCYLNDHCILSELPLHETRLEHQDEIKNRFAGYLESVKRSFLKMKPQKTIDHYGMDDGHEIDFDRYVDALMDFASGNQMDNNYYIFRERKHRSVLSSLVLDMSPSTDEFVQEEIPGDYRQPGDGGGLPLSGAGHPPGSAGQPRGSEGQPKQETIFQYQKYATYLLSEAMNVIGDPFGIFSFYDYGPSATLFYILKDFNEHYSQAHYKKLAGFIPAGRGFSRLSVGLRHLIERMRTHEEKSKIIFFITDGFPCYFEDTIDKGEKATVFYVDGKRRVEVEEPIPVVNAIYKPRAYVLHDLRKVYEEAVIAGINLFCITLDGDSVPFMEEIFGNNLIYLPEISRLPVRLLDIFRKVTS